VEAELRVVVGADVLDAVDGAALQRRVDVARRDLLRHHAEPRHHVARQARHAELQPAQILRALDLPPQPAAHLVAGVAAGQGVDAEVAVHAVQHLVAAAVEEPGVLLRTFSMNGTVVEKASALFLPVKNSPPVCAISTLPAPTASMAWSAGTSSPAGKGWMRNRPSVISDTKRHMYSLVL
jgi:hypothetical protein